MSGAAARAWSVARGGERVLHPLGELGEVDLLITDVVMPHMDGASLVANVRKDRPGLKVIFMSGYAEDAFRKSLDSTVAINFLPKPFNLAELAQRVKETLAAAGD